MLAKVLDTGMRPVLFLGIFFLVLFSAVADAQTRYVTDTLVITFRPGPSTEYVPSRNLTSGARVEVLEELVDDGYSRVRLEDGDEGWVLSQYLQTDLTAAQRLATATRELNDIGQSAESLQGQASELETELIATRQSLAEAEASRSRLEVELADIRSASASAIETRSQNERLTARVSNLTAEVDLAEMEVRDLRSRSRQSWFIVGASVLLGGIVIGLVAPSFRRKRRSSW